VVLHNPLQDYAGDSDMYYLPPKTVTRVDPRVTATIIPHREDGAVVPVNSGKTAALRERLPFKRSASGMVLGPNPLKADPELLSLGERAANLDRKVAALTAGPEGSRSPGSVHQRRELAVLDYAEQVVGLVQGAAKEQEALLNDLPHRRADPAEVHEAYRDLVCRLEAYLDLHGVLERTRARIEAIAKSQSARAEAMAEEPASDAKNLELLLDTRVANVGLDLSRLFDQLKAQQTLAMLPRVGGSIAPPKGSR
jgi:hypothetical protein